MTPKQAIVDLAELPNDDPEIQHISADVILCQLLKSLGHEDVVEQYRLLVPHWRFA